LGKPIPDVPMPRGNSKEEFSKTLEDLSKIYLGQGLKNMSISFAIVAAGVGYYAYSK
jgi:hypothetical protein